MSWKKTSEIFTNNISRREYNNKLLIVKIWCFEPTAKIIIAVAMSDLQERPGNKYVRVIKAKENIKAHNQWKYTGNAVLEQPI